MIHSFSDVDGILCIQTKMTDYQEPIELIIHYPTDIRTSDFLRNFSISSLNDLAISRQESYGIYEFYYKKELYGPKWKIQLKDGEKTMPIETLKCVIPCPKVKSGIMTRYYDGQWQKYLKSKGWCPA